MPFNESDTRAKLIDPAIHGCGWTEDLIRREETAGTVEVVNGKARRRAKGRVDYVLRIKVNTEAQPVAVARSGVLANRFPVAITAREVSFNQDIKAILSDSSQLDSEYLLYWLKSKESDVLRVGVKTGATVHSLRSGYLEGLEIDLPPLPEQKRIAAMLNEQMGVMECIREQIEHQTQQSIEVSAAAMRSIFDAPEASDWPHCRIGEFAETTSGSTPPRGNPAYYQDGTIPWVKTGELKDDLISSTEERITGQALAECSLQLLPEGTLLIAMYGQGQTRGRTGLLGVPATTNQACFAILPKPATFDPRFLQYWFRYSYQRLRRETEGRGGNQPNLNGLMLRGLEVPLPDVEFQRKIADVLDQKQLLADRIETRCEEIKSAAQSLPAAYLRRAFAGEL